MRVRRIGGEKFWCDMKICRRRSDFFGRVLWTRGLKSQDWRILSHLFASKRCLHLPKTDLDAFLSVLLTGNVVRQTRKEGSTAYL